MDQTLQAQLAALGDEVGAAAIPDGCKHTAVWCAGRLPGLYAQFRQTSESRYGDEITRLVQAALKELATSQRARPEAEKLAASMTDRLRVLHEQFGLPGLNLTPLGARPTRSRKAV
jgi:hypothetical protein